MTDDAKTDDWPSHHAELTRKGFATLNKWAKAYAAGKITSRELYILVDGMWDTVSGLCAEELQRALEAVHEEIRRNAARKR